jgi:hypothetical protein
VIERVRIRTRHVTATRRPPQGVALPVVVLCLAALTVLLLGLVLTASTELVVSLAHRETTEDLYASEAAIHAWIAENGPGLTAVTATSWIPEGTAVPVRIQVDRLAAAGASSGYSLFAVHAEPERGEGRSRAVTAMIRTRPYLPSPFLPSLRATITAGGDTRVERVGSAGFTLLDGGGSGCAAPMPQAESPVIHAAGSTLLVVGTGVHEGTPLPSELGPAALLGSVLGGHRVRDLAWNADIRFGRHFNELRHRGSEVQGGAPDTRLDWGCPAELIGSLPPGSVTPCLPGSGEDRWPIVAIDAENDTVRISAHHGQGMLIVVNGHLQISGPFVYRGLILAERSVRIAGGGAGWPPSISGAIVAGGGVTVLDGRDPVSGHSTVARRVIQFDRCALDRAVQVFNAVEDGRWGTRRVLGRPFAWAEVMR